MSKRKLTSHAAWTAYKNGHNYAQIINTLNNPSEDCELLLECYYTVLEWAIGNNIDDKIYCGPFIRPTEWQIYTEAYSYIIKSIRDGRKNPKVANDRDSAVWQAFKYILVFDAAETSVPGRAQAIRNYLDKITPLIDLLPVDFVLARQAEERRAEMIDDAIRAGMPIRIDRAEKRKQKQIDDIGEAVGAAVEKLVTRPPRARRAPSAKKPSKKKTSDKKSSKKKSKS